jgi:hypothetical protein
MATKEQLKNARELLDLDVKEISLVDRPANLREFLIVKRQTENNLGEFEVEPSVIEWLEKMAGTTGAPTKSIKALAAALTGGTPMETVEMIKARHAYEAEIQKAGQTEESQEDLEKRHAAELETVTKADSTTPTEPEVKPEEAEPEPATSEPVAKNEPAAEPELAPSEPLAEPDPEDQPMVVIKRDGSITVQGAQVQKAKTFGKAKTATLQNAVSALAKLLGDVSEEALKSAMAPYMDPTKKVEKNAGNAAEEPPEPKPTADPAELITKAVATALEPISKRLEEIEKTRNPSQSVEGDGGTDSKSTQVEKSIWSGIL